MRPEDPPPTFLCKSIIPGQLFFDILQEYHSKWLSGHLFWGVIFAENTDSTWVAPLMRLAPSARIVVVCKEYHSKGVSSKSFRRACKSIILRCLLSARIALWKRETPLKSAPLKTEARPSAFMLGPATGSNCAAPSTPHLLGRLTSSA